MLSRPQTTPTAYRGAGVGQSMTLPPLADDDDQQLPFYKNPKVLTIAAGVGAVVLTGAGLIYAYLKYRGSASKKSKSSKQDSSSSSSSSSSSPSSSSSEAESESAAPPRSMEEITAELEKLTPSQSVLSQLAQSARPSDDQFQHVINLQIQDMQEKGSIDDRAHSQVLVWLRKAANSDKSSCDGLSPRTRTLGAQWLVLYHTVKAVKMTQAEEAAAQISGSDSSAAQTTAAAALVRAWHAEHLRDMTAAWKLIDGVAVAGDEDRQLTLFRLDIAQRLRDIGKMTDVYNTLNSIGQKSPEELIAAFMVAPMLGRWRDTVKLGTLATKLQSLKEFHQLALQRADIPDYSILYEEAKDSKRDTPRDQMAWENYDVVHIATTLLSVSAPGESGVDEEQKKDEKELVVGQCAYHRMGAVVRMVSPSPVPIPLTGIATNTHFKLQGYALISQSQQLFVHREKYECDKDEKESTATKHIWKGKFTIQQEPNTTSSTDPNMKILLEFAVQLTMQKND